jgi:hypothetical protein
VFIYHGETLSALRHASPRSGIALRGSSRWRPALHPSFTPALEQKLKSAHATPAEAHLEALAARACQHGFTAGVIFGR